MKIAAMNAQLGRVDELEGKGLIFEPKLDGIRALCYVDGGIRLISRNDNDLTQQYSDLQDIRSQIHAKSAILDGEIVAYDNHGIPRFQLLQQGYPVHFVVFDILMKNGKNVTALPLLERKKLLDETVTAGQRIEKIFFTTEGQALWQEVKKRHMEGVVAKMATSHYYPGKRSPVWRKIKLTTTIDCVILGYTSAKRKVSSLALGLYSHGHLRYVGKVGTGFDEETIDHLSNRLYQIHLAKPVHPDKGIFKGIHWVRPEMVCEVTFSEITHAGRLRAPVFIRLREDKAPHECTIEDQISTSF